MEKKADLMASDLEGDNVLMMAISQNHLDIAAGFVGVCHPPHQQWFDILLSVENGWTWPFRDEIEMMIYLIYLLKNGDFPYFFHYQRVLADDPTSKVDSPHFPKFCSSFFHGAIFKYPVSDVRYTKPLNRFKKGFQDGISYRYV